MIKIKCYSLMVFQKILLCCLIELCSLKNLFVDILIPRTSEYGLIWK